jgi:(1->4)-alpha-D-glucan 1-alpha-D-glucosylmutase
MAKSLEDTAFYRWHRLVALNEVGGEPDHFGTDMDAFHAHCRHRAERWQGALLATATHDTKRGEDTRLRIAALSEHPDLWQIEATRWAELNRSLRADLPGGPAPDPGSAYLFYQALVGCWPFDLRPDDGAGLGELAERLVAYMRKACREAKLRTSWTAQDEAFESAVESFVRGALDPSRSGEFLNGVAALVGKVTPLAALHGLSQTLVKLTAPGIPDIYQGAERWDLSLVDPDNRRPVPFDRLGRELDRAADPRTLLAGWQDGRIKQWLVAHALATRTLHPDIFREGAYEPVRALGRHADRVVAFARARDEGVLVTVAPRLVAPLLGEAATPLVPPEAWGDTALDLEPFHRHAFVDVLADRRFAAGDRLPLRDLLTDLPIALLESGALRG